MQLKKTENTPKYGHLFESILEEILNYNSQVFYLKYTLVIT